MRVSEQELSKIVSAIAAVKLRPTPKRGDLEGDYEAWFDGGAIRYVTGSTEYYFRDGTIASIGIEPEKLTLTVRYSDGRVINILQQ
jgi:hypothetical protein